MSAEVRLSISPPRSVAVHLIVQYYVEPREDRRDELHYCMRKNLADPRIAILHDLQAEISPPADIADHPKYRQVPTSGWLTFARAFQYANESLRGEIVALANLDIFLSPEFSVDSIRNMSRRVVLALARWEFDPDSQQMWLDPTFAKLDMSVSQDMWVFQPPVQIDHCDFPLGVLGCDHAIAHRIRASGYLPVNACLRLKICHLDRCRGKSGRDGLNFHRQRPEIQQFPGREGALLLPCLRDNLSLDAAAERLKLGEYARYRALLDLWNANVKVRDLADGSPPPASS